jgi:hypothetical protein
VAAGALPEPRDARLLSLAAGRAGTGRRYRRQLLLLLLLLLVLRRLLLLPLQQRRLRCGQRQPRGGVPRPWLSLGQLRPLAA